MTFVLLVTNSIPFYTLTTRHSLVLISNLALHIDNVLKEKVTCFDFLGLRVSDTLKWQDHTNKIANKISKSVGVMSRLKHLLQSSTLLTIYNSLCTGLASFIFFNFVLGLWISKACKITQNGLSEIFIERSITPTQNHFLKSRAYSL